MSFYVKPRILPLNEYCFIIRIYLASLLFFLISFPKFSASLKHFHVEKVMYFILTELHFLPKKLFYALNTSDFCFINWQYP